MNTFYLGTHQPHWLAFADFPLFVSHRRLKDYRTLPRARVRWALDSGGFSELSMFSTWQTTPEEYVAAVRRYRDEVGMMDWAAPQDWMCEPQMLARTGFTVAEHQKRTVANYVELTAAAPDVDFIPVIQGWHLEEYLACLQLYADAGVDLAAQPVVGVGSVCRRQAQAEGAMIFAALHARGLRLHGFGVKTTGLKYFGRFLTSSDSMAWSYDGRRSPPLPGHEDRHKNCANCYEYARQWRSRMLGIEEVPSVAMTVATADHSILGEIRRAAAEHPGAPISVDTETTSMDELWRGLVCRGISLAIGDRAWYLPLTHPHSESENLDPRLVRHLLLELAGQRRRWVWFNAKYDWSVLETLGLDAAAPADQWDASIGRWLEDENREIRDLKGLCAWLWPEESPAAERDEMRRLCAGPTLAALEDEHYYGSSRDAWEAAGRPRRPMGISRAQAREKAAQDPRYGSREMWDLTATEMAPYAAADARLTLRLYDYQRSLDHRHPIGDAMPREMEVARVLLGMERTGIRVDEGRANAAFAAATARLKELENLFEGTNLNAPHQVAELVYDRWGFDCPHLTEAGNKSVDRDALELLGDDPRIVSLLECRRLLKAISGYYKPLIHFLDDRGRIHPTFNQAKVRTGRLSAERPNTQTIPREDTLSEVRKVFVPDAGYELWEYDLAQAELRVAAALSGDERMIAAFTEGRDLYQETADELWCQRMGCVKKSGRCPLHRPKSKVVTLAFQYGQRERGLAASLLKGTGRAVTPDHVSQAAALQYRFGRMYPRLVAAQDRFADIARRDGRIPLPPKGRFRHFRGAGHAPEEYRKAFNSECQGGIGELAKELMVQAHRARIWDDHGARLLLQIHDSLVAEVAPGEGERIGKALQTLLDDVTWWPTVRQEIEAKQWM